MDYRPPSFRQPTQYDIPASLDSIFNEYQKMTAAREQKQRQDFADTVQYGTPVSGLTPEQLQKGAQGPFMPSGPTQTGQPMAPQFDQDPHVAAIQRFIQNKRSSEQMGAQTQRAELGKTVAETDKLTAEAERLRREAGLAGTPGGLKPENRAQIEGQIMDDYMKSPTYANLAAAKSGLRDLASIQTNKSGAADIAAIYSFIKTMDNNAVKEGEIALAQSALPGLDRAKLIYDNLKAGNKLTPQMKKELLAVGRGMYESKRKSLDESRSPFVKRAKQYQIDPEIAVPSLAIPDDEMARMFADAPAPPVPGAVMKTPKGGQPGWYVQVAGGWKPVR